MVAAAVTIGGIARNEYPARKALRNPLDSHFSKWDVDRSLQRTARSNRSKSREGLGRVA